MRTILLLIALSLLPSLAVAKRCNGVNVVVTQVNARWYVFESVSIAEQGVLGPYKTKAEAESVAKDECSSVAYGHQIR